MAEKDADRELLDLAKKRWKLAEEAASDNRRMALDDKEFAAGDQWDQAIRTQRGLDNRPCLTVNRMPQYINQLTNEQRQNRPSIQVNPVGSGSDKATADVIQGIIRHIEYDSGADEAYDWAFEDAVTGGYGYFRIVTDYSDEMTFDQDIKIKRIKNPFSVYFDPGSVEIDYSDANYGFVEEKMTREDFEATYPGSNLVGKQWKPDSGGWIDKDKVRICEYWWKEETHKTIYQWSDGTVTDKDDAPKGVKQVNKRKTTTSVVKWAKITDEDVLERQEWAGKWIPIIPVIGKELDIDGRQILKGVIRDVKDPQRQYNYMESAATEAIALAPKAPWVAVEGQLEGYERMWQSSNVVNRAVLTYKNVSLNGQPAPPPQRIQAEPPIQAMNEMLMRASDDMQVTSGVPDASRGVRTNETSGRGILARKQQGDTSNFHFTDNLSRALRHAGRVILDLIPHIYDTERVLRVIQEDGTQDLVQVNGTPGGQVPDGVKGVYDLTVGKYDVTISTGPSYQTKRQESVATQLQLVQSFPAVFPVIGDLMVRNMDIPGADQIADRMEKMLPPQLQDQDGQEIPPQVQQHVAQLTQQNQQMAQQLQAANAEIKNRMMVKTVERESEERIEFEKMKIETTMRIPLEWEKLRVQLRVAELAAKTDMAQADADREADAIAQMGSQAHEYAMSQAEHQQTLEQQQQSAQQQQEQAAQQQAQQGEQGGEANQ
jgi:hypothetical protein